MNIEMFNERFTLFDLAIFLLLTYCMVFSLTNFSHNVRLLLSVIVCGFVMFGFSWFFLPPVPRTQMKKFVSGLKVGAHRGAALDAPENTLSAFQLSKQLGADSIEFDLEFTSDGVPVVLHDDTVDRTTDGTGMIRNMSYKDVQKLNAAAKFSKKDPFEKVPTLTEFIDVALALDVKIFFDIKNFHSSLIDTITRTFQQHPVLYDRAAVCSFYPQIVYAIKRADPRIITGHTWRPWFLTHRDFSRTDPFSNNYFQTALMEIVDRFYIWNLHTWVWKVTGANLILTEKHSISWQYIKMWERRGLQVIAWTVNDYHEKLYYMKELKCPFFTDKLSDIKDDLLLKGEQFCESDTCKP